MRLKFTRTKQKKFLKKVKGLRNCSWKELSKFLKIDFETLRNWAKERLYIPEDIFIKIVNLYPQLKFYENYIIERKNDNWGQIKGGTKAGKIIKDKLRNDAEYRIKWVIKCKKGGRNNIKNGLIKNWHIGFRNIGRRRFVGPRNEKMFTETEKILADFL